MWPVAHSAESSNRDVLTHESWIVSDAPATVVQVAFDDSVTGKCAGQAQKWLRESNSMLKPGADMYPGDEDNGSMGAWFVMNMLGFYRE